MKRKGCLISGLFVPAMIIVLFVVDLSFLDSLLPSKAKKSLPDSASSVQEYYRDHGFTGDFVRVLKAKLPEQEFEKYAEELGLNEKYDPEYHGGKYDGVKFGAGGVPEWWSEPESMDNCYFDYSPGESYVSRVKWKDGWVYYFAQSW